MNYDALVAWFQSQSSDRYIFIGKNMTKLQKKQNGNLKSTDYRDKGNYEKHRNIHNIMSALQYFEL